MSSVPWSSIDRLAEVLDRRAIELRNLAGKAPRLYKPYDLVLPGKKPRHIDNPSGQLRRVQKLMARRILRRVSMPPFLFGSVRGRSAIEMARLHIGRPRIVAIDIRSCFPMTRPKLILPALVKHAGFGRETAALVTRLTTLHHGLPQGAPTSSFLLNLAMIDTHQELDAEARQRGLVYSVFIDDIVVSGKCPEPMLNIVAAALSRLGMQVNREKVRIMSGRWQEVLGLRLHGGLDVKQSTYDRIDAVVAKVRELGTITTNERARLDGLLAHLHAVNPGKAATLRAMADLVLGNVETIAGGPEARNELRVPCRHRSRHRRKQLAR